MTKKNVVTEVLETSGVRSASYVKNHSFRTCEFKESCYLLVNGFPCDPTSPVCVYNKIKRKRRRFGETYERSASGVQNQQPVILRSLFTNARIQDRMSAAGWKFVVQTRDTTVIEDPYGNTIEVSYEVPYFSIFKEDILVADSQPWEGVLDWLVKNIL